MTTKLPRTNAAEKVFIATFFKYSGAKVIRRNGEHDCYVNNRWYKQLTGSDVITLHTLVTKGYIKEFYNEYTLTSIGYKLLEKLDK